MADEKKKVGIWVAIAAGVLFLIGLLVTLLTGNSEFIKKAMEMLGRSKSNDEKRDNTVKTGNEQTQTNNGKKEEIDNIIKTETEKTATATTKIENQIQTNNTVTTTDASEQIKKNKKLLGGKK